MEVPIIRLPAVRPQPGFDFSRHMRVLCADLVARLPELAHIDLSRVAIAFCQTRRRVPHGLQATLTPLRFEGGSLTTHRRGRRLVIQRVVDSSDREMLYILSFYLPRFLDHPLREKLCTVAHELWHIGPAFDGDLRRFPGRCFAHGHSQRHYETIVEDLVDRWLAERPSREVYGFLEEDFAALTARHGRVWGLRIPAPRVVPADEAPAARRAASQGR